MDYTKTEVRGGWRIQGHKKGGDSPRSPIEAPDSLRSTAFARVLDMIGEGELEGLVDGLRSVYLNGTPLMNADGFMNFQGVTVDYRYGTQNQSHIPGFPAAERGYGVGLEVKDVQPWVQAISGRDLSAVRVMLGPNGLSQLDQTNGDVGGYTVAYEIDLQTGTGPWVTVVSSAFSGKTRSAYRRSHRVDLPASTNGWTLRVRRTTPNATSSAISDTIMVDSYTEVIDAKMRYPMCALFGITADASQFTGGVPTRSYDMYLLKMRIPSNYDPKLKIYTGPWDGSFKFAWTDNPAWIVYDLLTSDRYGLGDRIPRSMVDKYALYNIGRHCDEMVPDGKGGMEARFSCNVYFQQGASAYKVLQDLVSVFRGMLFWGSNAAVPIADMPRDPVYTYTNGNVLGGKFIYTGARLKDLYTSVLVSYSDMEDAGRQKVEPVVASDELMVRYGFRQTEMTAFGCTSRSQARRAGTWALATAHMERRGVSFSTSLEGIRCAPGQIIKIADNLIAGRRIGGRVVDAGEDFVVIETELEIKVGDLITVHLPNGLSEEREVLVAGGGRFTIDSTNWTIDSTKFTIDRTLEKGQESVRTVYVKKKFSAVPVIESVWALESAELKTQLFTVMSVMEGATKETYDVIAVQHEPGKYDYVDSNTAVDERPITVVPPSIQVPPTNLRWSTDIILNQGVSTQIATLQFDAAKGAEHYVVEWRRDDSDWVKAGVVYGSHLEIKNAYAGLYKARVKAVDSIGSESYWAVSAPAQLDGILSAPPAVTKLTAASKVFGIALEWGFPSGRNIIERTEIWYGETNSLSAARKYGDFAYPQKATDLAGLASGAGFFFWARLVDKNGLPGPWYPIGNGVYGQASSSAELILDYLNGQITETQLSQELLSYIEEAGGSSVEVQMIKTQLAAMYTIKTQLTVDGTPYLAGIGVGVENNEGVITSQILLAAQRVAVLNETNGVTSTPFVIQGGVVYMNSAFIAKASIGSAKLADWLESDARGPGGVPVLRLNFRTGEIQVNSAVTGQGRLNINNQNLTVRDTNDTLRVRLGIW